VLGRASKKRGFLLPEERKNFDLSTALRRINKAMEAIG